MDVFVLGIERSATTWVANILEAHSETEAFMEPLSSFTSVFNKWPNRMNKIQFRQKYSDYFKKEFEKVERDKRLFFSRFSSSKTWWDLDFYLAEKLHKKIRSKRAKNFLEYNFHRKGESFSFLKSTLRIKVIKELRLNFNSSIIGEINPKAKVIVVVRDYASNIKSIVEYVEGGGLIELKSLLDLKGNKKDYSKLIEYWVESYNNLIEGLEDGGINYIIVAHSSLLNDIQKETKRIFTFLNMDLEEQVLDYLEYSNAAGQGKHNNKRDWKKLLKKKALAREEIDAVLGSKINFNRIHPKLRKLF